MKNYDVIVIGAGNGGLAAAAKLARGGKSVAVFDRNDTPGGVATSFRRGRFEFEVSLHELCGFGRYDKPFGSVRQIFDDLGISDRVEWVDIPDAYRLITFDSPEPIDVVMPFGIEKYIDKMEETVPGSRKGMTQLFDLAAEYLKVTGAFGKVKGKADGIKLLLNNRDFLHTCSMNVNDVLREMDIPERAADIFRGYWAYICADCDNLTFLHYLSMVNSYIELGSVIPASRSTELTSVLCDVIEENGGKLYLGSEVKKILVKDGRAYGIVTSGGEEYRAGDILCDIAPDNVYGSMIERTSVPEKDLKKVSARELSGRGFCVYLGLNRSADELGLKDYSYFIYPDMDTVKQYRLMGSPETNRVQNTVCQNAVKPDASPEGTCMLTMTTLFPSDYWDGLSEKEYYERKNSFARSMINVFEQATGVEIGSHIEEIEISAPQTFARFMNSPGGAIYGYRGSFVDGMLARKLMDKKSSEIDRLSFIGGFAENLNGYSSAFSSGMGQAKYILRRGEEM